MNILSISSLTTIQYVYPRIPGTEEDENLPTENEAVALEMLLVVGLQSLNPDHFCFTVSASHIQGPFDFIFEVDNLHIHNSFDGHVICFEIIFP
jgi:hypothetical protein